MAVQGRKRAGGDDLQLVFLEGATGVGKSTLTSKLQKMGYEVYFEGFVDLCKENPRLPPTSCMPVALRRTHSDDDSEVGSSPVCEDRTSCGLTFKVQGKDVVDLSGAVERKPRGEGGGRGKQRFEPFKIMREVQSTFPCIMVLCVADDYATRLRVAGRLFDSSDEEKTVDTPCQLSPC
eukprot:746941-Hanusia_phi.AAC.1